MLNHTYCGSQEPIVHCGNDGTTEKHTGQRVKWMSAPQSRQKQKEEVGPSAQIEIEQKQKEEMPEKHHKDVYRTTG